MFLGILLIWLFRVCISSNLQENSDESTMNSTFSTGVPGFSTELDYNLSTSFDMTEIPNTTTEEPLRVLKTLNVKRYSDDVSCLCDLQIQACNIGCCCDKDCTEETRKLFRQCDGLTETDADRSSCEFSKINYVNFTVQEWEVQNNDLLCVVRRNLPPSYTIQKEKPFRSYTEMKLHLQSDNFWPRESTKTQEEFNYTEPYTQGTPIKYVLDNTTLGIFKLSESYFENGCDFQSDITYLENFESECVQVLNENNDFLRVDTYGTTLFVAQPEKFNISSRKDLLTCPEPVCLKPAVGICTDFRLTDCRDLELAGYIFECQNKSRQQVNCVNIVDSLKLIVSHNGTEGIKKISLMIHMVNVTYELGQQYQINQKLSVVYEWASIKTRYSDMLSGNPGYLIGSPILIGTSFNGTILRDSDSFPDNFLVLPQENMGICEIGKHKHQPVEFGYSTILLCRIQGKLPIRNDSKPADICRKMQEDIFRYWSIVHLNGNLPNRTYGLFGNANSTVSGDWGDILFEKMPIGVLENITGRFRNENKSLSCHGLVFGLSTYIYHARVEVKNLVDQKKILAITNQFHTSFNENSTFHIINYNVSYEFDLDTRVAFWDITSRKFKIPVDPPSLNIKLPSDFFYPFVKMENDGEVEVPNFLLIMSVCFYNTMSLYIELC